jgi:cell shape-determining protein MreD
MNPRRVIAGAVAVITALLLQAGVVSPVVAPLAVSLPAVLVASVGLMAGPSAGMSVGFSSGLLADLASPHPAGVLALAWLLLGLATGLAGDPRRRLLVSIALAGVAVGVVGLVVVVVLVVVGSPSSPLGTVVPLALPSALGDLGLAALVLPMTRAVVRAVPLPAGAVLSSRSRVSIDA